MQYTDKLEKLSDNTYKIEVTIAWPEVEKAKSKALAEFAKTTKVKGFREGKAPLNLVLEKVGEQKLLEEASTYVLTDVYKDLITKHSLKPFIDPKISLLKAPNGGEWVFRFEIAGPPEIKKLPDYRKIAKEVVSDLKKEEIWVPGKKDEKKPEEKIEENKNKKIQSIFDKIMTSTDIEISPLILDAEVNRRLTSLYEEIKKLGLTVEQYLESKKLTAASLREKLTEETKDLYKSEFLLEQIADKEQITVDKTDLDKVFKQAKSKEEEALYKNNSYLYTRLLRKQKTLDFLANL